MDEPFLYVTVLWPLVARGQQETSVDWLTGAWPEPGTNNRQYDSATRTDPYVNPEPIRRLVTPPRRHWRNVDRLLAPGVHCRVAELVRAEPLTPHAPEAYGLVHLEISRGPRGGTSEQLKAVSELSRPRRQRAREAVESLLHGWQLDERVARATVVALVTDTSDPPPFHPPATASVDAWFDVLTELPTDTMPDGAVVAGERLLASGLVARIARHGVVVAPPPGWRSYVGEIRGQLADAMLLAVLQRDWLLGFARELADGEEWNRKQALSTAGHFDEFRRQWWWQSISDMDRVGAVFETWQRVGGSATLMQQLVGEIGDLRSEHRARSTEMAARVSVCIAAASFVAAICSLIVAVWT